MKILKYIILFVLFTSCAVKINEETVTKASCNENLEFKQKFFQHIKNVDEQMLTQMDDSFDISLEFISRYTYVSFESMANYASVYPIGIFEKDKANWLKWYEDNKCNNIQFQDNEINNDKGTD